MKRVKSMKIFFGVNMFGDEAEIMTVELKNTCIA